MFKWLLKFCLLLNYFWAYFFGSSYYLVLILVVYLDFFISLHNSVYSYMYLQCPAFLVSQFEKFCHSLRWLNDWTKVVLHSDFGSVSIYFYWLWFSWINLRTYEVITIISRWKTGKRISLKEPSVKECIVSHYYCRLSDWIWSIILFLCRYECTVNERKAVENRDVIKRGYDKLAKELQEFTGLSFLTSHLVSPKPVIGWTWIVTDKIFIQVQSVCNDC